jgi:hypothetical protein
MKHQLMISMINFYNQPSIFSSFFSLSLFLIYLFFNLFTTCIYTQIHLFNSSDNKSVHSNPYFLSTFEIQQKFSDNILHQLEIITRRLNDFNRRMDDFNIRLKLIEKSSLHKQRREFIHDDNNTSINPFNNDLRF